MPPSRDLSQDETEQLDALRRLGTLLGVHVLVEESDDLVDVTAAVAERQHTTYVLMGPPPERRGLRRFGEPVTERLLRRLPGVDVRIIADRTKRQWAAR